MKLYTYQESVNYLNERCDGLVELKNRSYEKAELDNMIWEMQNYLKKRKQILLNKK